MCLDDAFEEFNDTGRRVSRGSVKSKLVVLYYNQRTLHDNVTFVASVGA